MATKFLDYTGLSYLWSKFKEWCNSIFVTKATDEDITGTKTFVGSKKIAFKQSGANDKLGFTLYNNSNKEQGYLEYNPTNKIAGVPLMTLGNYATAANELTYVGFRRYSNISGASGAYNLLAPLISDAKTPFNLTTTYTNFYLPLGISDGTNIVTASNSGIFDISSLLSSISTIEWSNVTSKPTTISGYGITDAKIDNGTITLGSNTITPLTSHQTLPVLSTTVSGSGNAITDITVSDHTITVTKGASYITSSDSITGNAATATKLGTSNVGASNNPIYLNAGTPTATGGILAKTIQVGVGADAYSDMLQTLQSDNNNYRSCTIRCENGDGYNTITLGAHNETNGAPSGIYVKNTNGTVTAGGPHPAADANDDRLATTKWVKDRGYLTSVSGTAGTSLLAWNTENTVYTVGGHAIKVKLPANPNTDTHWTSHLYAGASNGNANAATTNGNTYLIICDNSTARDRRLIKGTGATTVTSDANGNIIINSTDNNTVYTHPTTAGNKHIPAGGSSGQILRWSAAGTAAWGADNNTTYSAATQSAAGLMSAADKKKLDGINATAGKYTLKATWNAVRGSKTITGCTVGKPLFVIHKLTAKVDNECNSYIKVTSGTADANTEYHHYMIGQQWGLGGVGGCNAFVCIPTATSVTFAFEWNGDSHQQYLVYG